MKLCAYLSAVIVSFLATSSFATDFTIEMLNKDAEGNRNVYSEEVVKVEVGDTVTWLPTSKGHNVEMVASPNKMHRLALSCLQMSNQCVLQLMRAHARESEHM